MELFESLPSSKQLSKFYSIPLTKNPNARSQPNTTFNDLESELDAELWPENLDSPLVSSSLNNSLMRESSKTANIGDEMSLQHSQNRAINSLEYGKNDHSRRMKHHAKIHQLDIECSNIPGLKFSSKQLGHGFTLDGEKNSFSCNFSTNTEEYHWKVLNSLYAVGSGNSEHSGSYHVNNVPSVEQLSLLRDQLTRSAELRESRLKSLTKKNFDKFVQAKLALENLYNELKKSLLSSGGSQDHKLYQPLLEQLDNLSGLTEESFRPVLERKYRADRLHSVLQLMNRFEWFLGLPERLQSRLRVANPAHSNFGFSLASVKTSQGFNETKRLEQLVHDFSQAKRVYHNILQSVSLEDFHDELDDNGEISSEGTSTKTQLYQQVEKVWFEVEKIISSFRRRLYWKLSDHQLGNSSGGPLSSHNMLEDRYTTCLLLKQISIIEKKEEAEVQGNIRNALTAPMNNIEQNDSEDWPEPFKFYLDGLFEWLKKLADSFFDDCLRSWRHIVINSELADQKISKDLNQVSYISDFIQELNAFVDDSFYFDSVQSSGLNELKEDYWRKFPDINAHSHSESGTLNSRAKFNKASRLRPLHLLWGDLMKFIDSSLGILFGSTQLKSAFSEILGKSQSSEKDFLPIINDDASSESDAWLYIFRMIYHLLLLENQNLDNVLDENTPVFRMLNDLLIYFISLIRRACKIIIFGNVDSFKTDQNPSIYISESSSGANSDPKKENLWYRLSKNDIELDGKEFSTNKKLNEQELSTISNYFLQDRICFILYWPKVLQLINAHYVIFLQQLEDFSGFVRQTNYQTDENPTKEFEWLEKLILRFKNDVVREFEELKSEICGWFTNNWILSRWIVPVSEQLPEESIDLIQILQYCDHPKFNRPVAGKTRPNGLLLTSKNIEIGNSLGSFHLLVTEPAIVFTKIQKLVRNVVFDTDCSGVTTFVGDAGLFKANNSVNSDESFHGIVNLMIQSFKIFLQFAYSRVFLLENEEKCAIQFPESVGHNLFHDRHVMADSCHSFYPSDNLSTSDVYILLLMNDLDFLIAMVIWDVWDTRNLGQNFSSKGRPTLKSNVQKDAGLKYPEVYESSHSINSSVLNEISLKNEEKFRLVFEDSLKNVKCDIDGLFERLADEYMQRKASEILLFMRKRNIYLSNNHKIYPQTKPRQVQPFVDEILACFVRIWSEMNQILLIDCQLCKAADSLPAEVQESSSYPVKLLSLISNRVDFVSKSFNFFINFVLNALLDDFSVNSANRISIEQGSQYLLNILALREVILHGFLLSNSKLKQNFELFMDLEYSWGQSEHESENLTATANSDFDYLRNNSIRTLFLRIIGSLISRIYDDNRADERLDSPNWLKKKLPMEQLRPIVKRWIKSNSMLYSHSFGSSEFREIVFDI